MVELLKRLNEEGNTIVLITHDMSVANEAKRVIRISDGKIIDDRMNGNARADGLNGNARADGLNGNAKADGLNGNAGTDGLNGKEKNLQLNEREPRDKGGN